MSISTLVEQDGLARMITPIYNDLIRMERRRAIHALRLDFFSDHVDRM